MSFIKVFTRATALCALFTIGCGNITDLEDREPEVVNSIIRPAQPFFSEQSYIDIYSPVNGAAFNIESANFEYKSTGDFSKDIYFSLFLILDSVPTQVRFKEDFRDACIAGVSSQMSSWNFSQGSINISQLYGCEATSPTFLGTTSVDSATFITGKTYYWLIIAFDTSLDMSHSSSLRQFIVTRGTP